MLLTVSLVKAQQIKGRVVDSSTGKPIAGASIYLNGIYKGMITNEDGKFALFTDQTDIPLIISFVGYESQTINNYAGQTLDIRLVLKLNELHEVVIGGGGGMSRDAEMKIFLTQFLGAISKDCVIGNPDEISFTYHKKTQLLEAAADQPLTILNKKLGYKITYFLSLFKYAPGELAFQGNYFFAEDTTLLKQKDIRKIKRARNEAYYGSRMHFIRSLWADSLSQQGFAVYNKYRFPVNYNDLVITNGEKKYMAFAGQITIFYKGHTLLMKPVEAGKSLIINNQGFFDPMIYWGGDLGTKRMNELLPFEFRPTP